MSDIKKGLGIKKEDIDFLKELQNELLTQDHVSQAAPRFWVVRGTVKVYGVSSECCDGEELVHDSEAVADSLDKALDYIEENYSEELEEKNIVIERGTKMGYSSFVIDKDTEDERDNLFYDLDDVVLFLEEYLDASDYSVTYYREEPKLFENTMFLTNRECKAHIKANYYHYPEDAHSYAMTAWRAPEVARVWDMLEKIDWSKIETLLEED